ncbi:MAG: hypothetical protein M1335_04805 [Chloroflexi bacterium]|nr:hypothetical protein [Chloroflexota bacterium]
MQTRGRYLRPLGIADILDETADLYRANFILLIGIAAVLYVPFSVISGALTSPMANTGPDSDPMAVLALMGPRMMLLFLFMAVVMPIVTGALTFAVSERYLGRPTSIGECYRRVLRADVFFPFLGALALKYGALFALYLGSFLIIFIAGAAGGMAGSVMGFLAAAPFFLGMIVLLVYVGLRLILVEPAFIVEMKGAAGSLGRSWALMSGSVGKAFALVLIAGLVIGLISVIMTGPTQAIIAIKAQQGMRAAPGVYLLNTVLSTLVNVLTVPLFSIVVILLYYDARIRREGFDLELLARELDEKSAARAQDISSLPQEEIRPRDYPTEPGPPGERQ